MAERQLNSEHIARAIEISWHLAHTLEGCQTAQAGAEAWAALRDKLVVVERYIRQIGCVGPDCPGYVDSVHDINFLLGIAHVREMACVARMAYERIRG